MEISRERPQKRGQIGRNASYSWRLVILAAHGVTAVQRRGRGGVGILYGRTRFRVLSIAKSQTRGILIVSGG